MIRTAATTRTQISRARSALGVFVVVLLNLAVQPCAMALGNVEDHDCPRCPPSHNDEHSNHAMRGHEMAGHDMAGHDGTSGEMPCATDATNCSLAEELNYDGRAVKLEVEDSPNDLPIAIHPSISNAAVRRPARNTGRHSTRSPPHIPSVPLNVYYCVYLK
ncbi:MAG: hypothetical protein KJN77_05600 [Gammaproteobacteria bacterium]|nr:hypothetical protein [Gammaproteobacteria bacterium]